MLNAAHADFADAVAAYDAGDFAKAFKEWARLAEQGDVAAMRNVGQLYRFGQGTEKNLVKAAEWYRRAAEAGLDRAQANLAALYLTGEGVPQSYSEAAKWFGQAAQHGLPVAEYNLGLLYEHGLGIEKSDAKALGWYNLAARAGEPHALEKLSELVQKTLPATLDSLSRDTSADETAAVSKSKPGGTEATTLPVPPKAAKPNPRDDGGVFQFLGNVFNDPDAAHDKPAPEAAPARAATVPAPAAAPAPVATPAVRADSDPPPSAKDDQSFGDGVLHVLGKVFSTNPEAGRPIDADPAAGSGSRP